MAKTLTLFIALALTGVAAFFSHSNLGKMKQERVKIANLETRIDAVMQNISETRDDIAARRNEVETEQRTKGQREGELRGLLSDIEGLKREVPALDSQLEQQQATIASYEGIIEELKGFFAEMNVQDLEELNELIRQLASDRVAREREVAETEAALEAANAEIARIESQLASARQEQVERSRAVAVNTIEPRVVAVNQDWGFVIVNAGSSQGFSADNSLLVKRGDSFIGKLTITSINNNQIVADIVPGSVPRGQFVQPGDNVILENPNR